MVLLDRWLEPAVADLRIAVGIRELGIRDRNAAGGSVGPQGGRLPRH